MVIDEKTKVPLFAVLIALPFVLGGILWLTSIDAKASEALSQMSEVRSRLIRIENLLMQKDP